MPENYDEYPYLQQLDFDYTEEENQNGELPPVRRTAVYETEGSGTYNPVRVIFTLAADWEVSDELLDRYTQELRFYCDIRPEEEAVNNSGDMNPVIDELSQLLEGSNPHSFPNDILRFHLAELSNLLRHTVREEIQSDGDDGAEDDVEVTDTIYVDFTVHPDDLSNLDESVYFEYRIDPPINHGEVHSYPVWSVEVANTIFTDGHSVKAGFGQPTSWVAKYPRTLYSRFNSGCFKVKGISSFATRYAISGGVYLTFNSMGGRNC